MKTNHSMRHALALLLAAAVLTACSGTDQAPQDESDAPTAEEVAREAEEAAASAAQYADAQMTRYRAQMRDQLDALEARLDSMQQRVTARSAELGEDAKAQWNETLIALRQQSRNFEQELDQAGTKSGEAMEQVQRSLDKAWTDLKASVQKVEQEWRDSSDEDS